MRRAAGVKKAGMSPVEVVRAREVLGLTQEGLAAHLAVTEREVHGWEGGSIRVSARHGRQLTWDAALREREDALAASGLPECEWMAQEDARTVLPADLERHFAAINAHAGTCETCRARVEFEDARFGDLPEMPSGAGARAMEGLVSLVERLPGWARPAVYGAVIVGAMVLLRVTVVLLVQGPSLQLLEMAAVGLAMGAYLGLVGGISYTLVREPLRGLGRAGDYLTGITCVFAYLLAFLLPMALFSDNGEFRDPLMWIISSVVGLFFGLLVGHSWLRSDAPAPRASRGTNS